MLTQNVKGLSDFRVSFFFLRKGGIYNHHSGKGFTFLGRAICHQLPERSFFHDGHYLPVCARDTGIYIGIFSTLLFLYMTKKYRTTTIPNKKISFTLLLFLFPLVIDGFSSYLGIYSTTNLIRILTGIMFGMALPFFLIPLL